mmetsp:Transcript_12465/g.34615  ORF Transcript_12465/g.34615 Transcript_12465/m.34615 type:complete len:357 (+) Transcript_12465:62-1132(+)
MVLESISSILQQILPSFFVGEETAFTPVLDKSEGGQKEFDDAFQTIGSGEIGQGEFGTVWILQRRESNEQEVYACKTLPKGSIFRDNVLYEPMKPGTLQAEIDCLRALKGEHHCLKLFSVYESKHTVRLVTDYCPDGDLKMYCEKRQPKDDGDSSAVPSMSLSTLSSLSYQLLDALSHCHATGIIHRDIKPQNCLISEQLSPSNSGAHPTLTLIDFGSSAIHQDYSGDGDLPVHSTYCGSPFYMSPELFQKIYTQKTDIWSAGVVLYVCAAGSPKTERSRQEIFDILIVSVRANRSQPRHRQWVEDPLGVPTKYAGEDGDFAFADLLNSLLIYKHKERPNARELLQKDPFLQLWRD